jgi:hypothetical protein
VSADNDVVVCYTQPKRQGCAFSMHDMLCAGSWQDPCCVAIGVDGCDYMYAVILQLYAIVVAFVHGVRGMQRGDRGLAVSIVRTSAIRLRSGRLSIEEHQTRMYFPLADKEVMGIGSTVLCSPLNIGLTSKLMLRLLIVGASTADGATFHSCLP